MLSWVNWRTGRQDDSLKAVSTEIAFWCVLSEPVVSGKPGPSTLKRCLGWCFVDFHGLNGSAMVNSNWPRVSDEPGISTV